MGHREHMGHLVPFGENIDWHILMVRKNMCVPEGNILTLWKISPLSLTQIQLLNLFDLDRNFSPTIENGTVIKHCQTLGLMRFRWMFQDMNVKFSENPTNSWLPTHIPLYRAPSSTMYMPTTLAQNWVVFGQQLS